jgi:hypothetical protein
LAKFFLLCRTDVFEILIPEDHNTTFRNQQGKLVLLSIRELGQLQSFDL